ncbi:hypothetical protein COO60DRAFT_1642097 [Scenedesmus sp. NREL 46B-D3]|nr:hypothetical protein COO60DRAFT_1642097 [Scenedesmus sp. NREL 46B-D3]
MPAYENMSTEELRWENYQAGVKAGSTPLKLLPLPVPAQPGCSSSSPEVPKVITALPSHQHLSTEELRFQQYNAGLKFNKSAVQWPQPAAQAAPLPYATALTAAAAAAPLPTSQLQLLLLDLALPDKTQQQQQPGSTYLWQPANPLQMSPTEAAAVQEQLTTMDVNTAQSQLRLSLPDALAALLLADGDLEEAHVLVAYCADHGGPAKKWDIFGQPQEVEVLLQKLHSTGVDRDQVVRVVRVQSPKLWVRYCIRQCEMQDEMGAAGVNEQQLFHGTSATAAAAITQEGFGSRLNSASVEPCPGKHGIERAPDGCDSLHDTRQLASWPMSDSGSVSRYHVIFDNNSAYPENVITVQQ